MGVDILICARHYFSNLVPISAFVERYLPFSLLVVFWVDVDFCENSFMIELHRLTFIAMISLKPKERFFN